MNILFSAEYYPTPDRPVTAFIAVLCREMTKQGHQVTVIAPQSLIEVIEDNNKKQPFHFVDEVKVGKQKKKIDVYCPMALSSGFGRLGHVTKWSHEWAVYNMAMKIPKPDVCYAHMWTSGYYILRYAKKFNIPLFVATGEDRIFFHNYLKGKELYRLREYVSGVICVSTKNLYESVECGLAQKVKCQVFPNAIDDSIFHLLDKNECRNKLNYLHDDFIIAFVGRFYDRKGVKRVSDAIKHINDSHIKSIFIGTNNPGETMQPDCDGILFKGKLPHDDIPIYLNSADIFVLPTLAEGCSNSIVEAMACGLPIISSDLPFNYDILNSGNSILVNPNDIDAIAAAIAKLRDNVPLRKEMSKKALKTACNLTIAKRTKKIMDFISSKL